MNYCCVGYEKFFPKRRVMQKNEMMCMQRRFLEIKLRTFKRGVRKEPHKNDLKVLSKT